MAMNEVRAAQLWRAIFRAERACLDRGFTLACFIGEHDRCSVGWVYSTSTADGELTTEHYACNCVCHQATVLPPQMEVH